MTNFYQKNDINFSVDYEKLTEYFLPRMNHSYPNVLESKEDKQRFYKNYSERANDIIMYPDTSNILWHQKLLKEYESTNSNPNSIVKSLYTENEKTHKPILPISTLLIIGLIIRFYRSHMIMDSGI